MSRFITASNAAVSTVTQFDQNTGYGTSNKYVALNTMDVVKRFEGAGYNVASISKARVLKQDKQGFQKHLIRMRHQNMPEIGGLFPEIVIVNAYDGTAAFKILLGLFRMVCANGLITGNTFASQRVVHLGDALDRVLVASETVQNQLPLLTVKIADWSSRQLTLEQQRALELEARALVVPTNAILLQSSYSNQTYGTGLLRMRRHADNSSDLFTTFNRIQENVLQGGLSYRTVDANGIVKNQSTRAVKSIDRIVELNQSLWNIAESYAA